MHCQQNREVAYFRLSNPKSRISIPAIFAVVGDVGPLFLKPPMFGAVLVQVGFDAPPINIDPGLLLSQLASARRVS